MKYSFDVSIDIPPRHTAVINFYASESSGRYRLILRDFVYNGENQIILYSRTFELSEKSDFIKVFYE
ncbi:hypothetical protein RW25_29970 [Bacillus sp. L_1B0_8]|nr:hypothetical protein RT27_32070 [Bacillus sp. L_1B0_5]KIQ76961.1 hypothetical protein RW25_29970 [Bacillus sp. L_1B0_8]